MKKYVLLLVASAFLACNKPTPKPMETNTNSNTNTELVKTYFEHFNKHDWEKMAAMYVPVADFKDPSLGAGIVKQTREQTKKKYTELNQLFPDVHDEVVAIYPSGEKHVVVEFISTGKAPDQTKFELPICTIFTIENGLISKDFTYYDNFSE
jgi:ketosteroid isomerase-like protein